jgi:hypothetical protein
LRGGKRKSQNVHPTFKIDSNVSQAKEPLIEGLLKEESSPQFDPSLRDFMDNSI